MPNRHIIAVASFAFGIVAASLAIPQSSISDKAEQVRTYLKIAKGQPALVAFMDFQCPSCQKNWPAIKTALAKHPGTKFYSVNFPLTNLHKNAFPAAVAYEIGRSRGAQESTYDDLLSGKQSLEPANLNAYLKAHRLPSIVGTAKAAKYEAKVNDQLHFALSLSVSKTPTVLLIDESGKLTEVSDLGRLAEFLR